MQYKSLNEVDLSNKTVLLRSDLNAPIENGLVVNNERILRSCLLYTSPSPRDVEESRMPSSA